MGLLYTALVSVIEGEKELGSIEGTATEIMEILNNSIKQYDQRKYLPHTPGAFTKKINRMESIYAKNGLLIESRVLHGNVNYKIYLQKDNPSFAF